MIGDFFQLESFFAHFFQQSFFHVIKRLGKIYIYFLRIYKTSGLIPQCVLLLFAIVAEFHDRWRLVNALTIFNYRNKELTEFVGSAKNLGLFPGVNRVEDHHSFFRIEFLICKADQIGLDLAGLLAVDTVYSLVARVGNLFCVFGKLDLRLEGIAVSVLYSGKFVYAAECRISAVISLVPTPQELILASWAFRLSIRYSSRSLDAEMVASSKPAAASIL